MTSKTLSQVLEFRMGHIMENKIIFHICNEFFYKIQVFARHYILCELGFRAIKYNTLTHTALNTLPQIYKL